MPICEKCGKEHDGKFGSGRFCSRSCANSRTHTQEIKDKISNSLKSKTKTPTKRELSVFYNYKTVEQFPNINLPKHKCVICGSEFYHLKPRKTCSNSCLKKLQDILNEKQRNKKHIKYKENKEWNENSLKKIYNYYYIYKTINMVNNRYYIGMHMTNDINDDYMGSGVALNKAIKKYGKDSFKKEIIGYYNCYKDLAEAEAKIITQDVLNDPLSYNLTLGGVGGPAFKGKHHTKQTRIKISKKVRDHLRKVNNENI